MRSGVGERYYHSDDKIKKKRNKEVEPVRFTNTVKTLRLFDVITLLYPSLFVSVFRR